MLGVTLPDTSGMGGDAFLIARTAGRIVVLNSSGRAAEELDSTLSRRLQLQGVPRRGPLAITVPGLVDAWRQVLSRFGTFSPRKVLQRARDVAAKGFPASRRFARMIQASRRELAAYRQWTRLYGGVKEGTPLVQKGMGALFDALLRKGLEEFYVGETARRNARALQQLGSPLTPRDFEAHQAAWVEPITTEFEGFRVHEMPPNTQGLTALQLLRLYALAGAKRTRFGGQAWTRALMKIASIAYRDRNRHVADPGHHAAPIGRLLDDGYLRTQLAEGVPPRTAIRAASDTTFLAAADREENVVGFIQSLFYPFGSGVVIGGILWQNRGYGFDTTADSPNRFAPGKRPRHTLSAMLAQQPGRMFCIGCAGADLRPQLHLQTLAGVACHGLTLESAIAAPRRLVAFDGGKTWLLWERQQRRGFDRAGAEGRPSPGAVGIVNALELREDYQKGVADPRGEGGALALP
jgi:gamma-glutamyltranspeptidase/glutathione hydrolase